MEITAVIDFEAISNPYIKWLGFSNKSELVYCYTIAARIKNDENNKWQYHTFVADIEQNDSYKKITTKVLNDIALFFEQKFELKSWKQITDKVIFYGWNPFLEQKFFKMFKQSKDIKMQSFYNHRRMLLSIDKLFCGSELDKNFFPTRDKAIAKLEGDEGRFEDGRIASEYGYYLYCIKKERKKINDKFDIFKHLNEKIIVDELKEYSYYDVYKTVFIYEHKKELRRFINDLTHMRKQQNKVIGEIKQQYLLYELKTIEKLLRKAVEKYPHYHFPKITIQLIHHGEKLESLASFSNSEEYTKFMDQWRFVKLCIEKVGCSNWTVEQFRTHYDEINDYISEKRKEYNSRRDNFKKTFYKKYIIKKA